MSVESSNPAHSLADSAACRAAFESLDLMVVSDVAMTETARLATYVLPAASQYEKPEATFFNLEFPHNTFHLRHPLLEPLEGTLPEPEIWARLMRALGVIDDAELQPLRDAAEEGLAAYAQAFLAAVAANPLFNKALPFVLYETLGPTLPDGLAGAAALWGLAQKAAMTYPDAVHRAGHADGNALFEAILATRSGVTFTVHEYEDDWQLVTHADHKIALSMPEMLDEMRGLADAPAALTTPGFPIVLSAGERRAYTANDIFRDPSWRKRDADGALRVSGSPQRRAAPRRAWRSARRCCRDTLPCPTDSGSTTSTPMDARQSLALRPIRSPPPNGATPTPARPGTSTCPRASKRRPSWAACNHGIGSPMPSMLPSLSRNHAAFSPEPLLG
jgi:anaerobic selenocysteine-containing dehydrogenase